MTYHPDLRSYLDALDELGDLRHVTDEVSADLEAAAFSRLATERREPATLFENVAGVEPGFRLLGGPAAVSSLPGRPLARVAMALGLPLDLTPAQLVDRLAGTWDLEPVPPVEVAPEKAPVKQHVLLGDDADLERFPVPRLHVADGGRYANSWGVIVVRTPDGSWTNWSIARIMMLDGKRMTGIVSPGQHLGMVWQQWAERGEPMPYALVQGGAPAVPVVGGIPSPREIDEPDLVGALTGHPLEVVRCETSDLLVPAGAEIVVEGHLSPERDTVEGPFGEFAGYAVARTTVQPVYSVEAITHRDDPIWPIVAEGRPADDFHIVTPPGQCAELLHAIRAAGLPVTTVWQPTAAASHWTVVSVPSAWREQLPGVTTQQLTDRLTAAMATTRSFRRTSTTFVLDDDVDPADDTDLLWALGTRVHPSARRAVLDGRIYPLLACYTPEEHASGTCPVTVVDALLPAPGEGRVPHSSFAQAYPDAVRERVLALRG